MLLQPTDAILPNRPSGGARPGRAEAGARAPERGAVERVLDALAVVPGALTGLAVMGIVLLTLWELIARLLETSARMARPTSVVLLVYICFLALAEAERRWEHMRVDFFVGLLAPRWQALVQTGIYLVTLGFTVLLTVLGWQYANAARLAETRDLAMGLPLFAIYLGLPLGCALLALQQLRHLMGCASSLLRGEAPPGRTFELDEESA